MTTIDSAAVERMTGKPSRLDATQSVIARLKTYGWLRILDEARRTTGRLEHDASVVIAEREAY